MIPLPLSAGRAHENEYMVFQVKIYEYMPFQAVAESPPHELDDENNS
jgi:hypothetical protein